MYFRLIRIFAKGGDIRSITIKIISIVIIIFVLAGVGIGFYYWQKISKIVSNNAEKTVFEIKEGESTLDIAERLEEDGYIRSAWYFATLAKYRHKILLPGAYLLSPNMKVSEIINKISSGETSLVKITIPEGYRAEQIAQYLDGKGSITYQSFITASEGYDGKLFPDTFYITAETTADDAVKLMYDDYLGRINGLEMSDDDIILASIVEREAKNDEERAAIAGVYKNRLNIDMKLEADPTVIYGSDSIELDKLSSDSKKEYKFWKSITASEYKNSQNPYNTYIFKGLPPGSICNPGLASMEAAENYQKHNYYYFFHDTDGDIHFSKTSAEHENAIAKYGLAK